MPLIFSFSFFFVWRETEFFFSELRVYNRTLSVKKRITKIGTMSTKSDDAKWAHDRVEMAKHRETSSTFHVHKPRPLGHDLPQVALEGHLLHYAFLGTFFSLSSVLRIIII